MTKIQEQMSLALREAEQVRRKRMGLVGIVALLAVVAIEAVLDYQLILSGAVRWAMLGGAFLVGALAARGAGGLLVPSRDTLAHAVEQAVGETAPVVATSIDPGARSSVQSQTASEALMDRVDERAAAAVASAPPRFGHLLRGPLAGLAVVAMILVGVGVTLDGLSLRRALLPWDNSAYTTVSLAGPSEDLPAGKAFTVEVTCTGRVPDRVTLYSDQAGAIAEGTPDANGVVRFDVPGIRQATEFVARGGDGASDVWAKEPYSLPEIASFAIGVTPPDYAKSSAGVRTKPAFSVLRGSALEYRIALNAPARSVVVERSARPRNEETVARGEQRPRFSSFRNVHPIPQVENEPENEDPVFAPDPNDPRVWIARWPLPVPDEVVYRLVIEGARGDVVRNEDPWRINVLPDAPPVARIDGHDGGEVIKKGSEAVTFDLRALDDIGLAEARFVFRKPGQPYSNRSIPVPSGTGRSWTAEQVLDLAPMGLEPLDIVAVHAEVLDNNTLDGPGLGRTDVVYLEVPLPPGADDGGGGGGGGGGGSEPVNPLELQMEILRSTMALPGRPPRTELTALSHDQTQNAEYTNLLYQEMVRQGVGLELPMLLSKAQKEMEQAAEVLKGARSEPAIPHEEAALGWLVEAAKRIGDAPGQCKECKSQADGLKIALRPPRPKDAQAQGDPKEGEKSRDALRKLMAEVQRQLEGQQKLNEAAKEAASKSASPRSPADQAAAAAQQQLSQQAKAAAGQARGMKAPVQGQGNPRAAAEELERASALQQDASDALAQGEGDGTLGEQSEAALQEALNEIAALLEARAFDSEAFPVGYERLVSDYLRSISYE